ncbi:MAG: 3-dehydroquinate synthase [Muribaculaceae bacterium]|nr:3-dehydroquinate synthase [Muribaculaceae bacterium]
MIISKQLISDVNNCISGVSSEQLFVLTDTSSRKFCLPLLEKCPALSNAKVFTMQDGDDFKNLDTVVDVWTFLGENGGTRHSMLINLGGGVVTDLGGFAANTFKRGIRYINIPTTLLSMVDAAVGGKTGINFRNLKNEIGVIHPAEKVIICADFLRTLDRKNLLSGYAEMLKHGLLKSQEELQRLASFDFDRPDYKLLSDLIGTSVAVKEEIVSIDPTEKGIRKALNLGHTIGHAFESLSHTQKRPILHGYAVAFGLIGELYLSYKRLGFPQSELTRICRFIYDNYGRFEITCDDYPALYDLMIHDKKNRHAGEINCTLLSDVGQVVPDCIISQDEILTALDFYRDTVGL